MDPIQQQQPYQSPMNAPAAPAKTGGGGMSFNIKRYVGTVLHYWYWFVLSLLVALIVAYIYLLMAKPLYLVKGALLIDQGEKIVHSDMLSKLNITDENKEQNNVDLYNEINALRSEDLMQEVVDSLNLNVNYFTLYKLHEKELYRDCPIKIVFDTAGFLGDYTQFSLKYTTDGRFNLTEGQRTRSVMYDTWITRPYGRFKIEYAYNLVPSEENYLLNDIRVVVRNRITTAQSILNEVDIKSADGRTSVLDLLYEDNIPERGVDILSHLLSAYFRSKRYGIDVNAQKARDFIDKNKNDLMKDLRGIDSAVEAVKLKNNVMNPEAQASTVITEKRQAQKNLDDLYTKKKALINLRNLLLNMDRYEIVVPIGIEDDILEGLVNDYNQLVKRLGTEEQVQELGNANPFLQRTLIELEALKRRILDVLARISEDISNDIEVVTTTETKTQNVAKDIAEADREITEIRRGYDILQNMYLKLFEKGIENEITYYNAAGKSKVIVAPFASSTPISPIARNIYMLAFLLGLLLPAVILLIKELLNPKILHEDDITAITDIPIVGVITKEKWDENAGGDTNIAVRPSVRSGIAEQFRILRANLDFIDFTDDKRVITVTSSESGEGKTFVALNMGIIMALSTKRVIVVEFDLRRPRMADILNISNTNGLSEYLEGTIELQYIIKPSGIHSNLYVINCGQVPPNPGDLLTYPSTQNLLTKLQDMFDVVIVDTAPVNIVSDAVVLSKHAGINMFVVRQDVTYKRDVKDIADLVNIENKVHTPVIVFNSVEYLLKFGYFSNPNKKYEQIILEEPQYKPSIAQLLRRRNRREAPNV